MQCPVPQPSGQAGDSWLRVLSGQSGASVQGPAARLCLLLLYNPGSVWEDLPRRPRHRAPSEITHEGRGAASQDLV